MRKIKLSLKSYEEFRELCDSIFSELGKAEKKHPIWPDDIVHIAGFLSEESGEAMQAAINTYHHGDDIELLKKEICHTAAVAFRFLLYLKRKEETKKKK